LTVEMASGHRLLSFQIEGQVLRGTDEEADAIAAFAIGVFAAMDGRPRPTATVSAGKGTKAAVGGPKAPRLPAPKGRPS
jgi:hypothetical protein